MGLKNLRIEITEETGKRTVAAVVKEAAGVSHAVAKGIVDGGHVRINGRVVSAPAARVTAGDLLEAAFDTDTRYRAAPGPARATGFKILLQDEHLVVVEKDAGVITVPAPSHPEGSLVDLLLAWYVARGARSPRLWVVHRIDRYTSGLVLFARTEEASEALAGQFERHTARREYLALCEGIPAKPKGRLESFLEEDTRSLKVRETKRPGRGFKAVSHYQVEESLPEAALVRVTLETGRRNQIRVQFAGMGHPLIGDRRYGNASPMIARVALHAARLGFDHPHTGRPVNLESPLPTDMVKLLRRLRHSRAPLRP